MKSLWTALAVLAVANLLALLGVAGWLGATGRVDVQRLRDVRALFSKTVAAERAEEAAAKAAEEAEIKLAAEKAKEGTPPVRAEEQLAIRIRESSADQVRLEGVRRDVQVLRDTLERERLALDEERTRFAADRKAWDDMRRQITQQEQDEQFKKTLTTLEGLKPDKSKQTLDQLIRAGNKDQVVAYLNAMQDRTRTKVVDEFIKTDPKLASDLLERLRTRGQIAQGPEAAPQ